MPERRYWFRRKRIGWGLEPGTREGWIAPGVFVAWAVGWLVLFIAFVIFKGEPLWKQRQQ
jgi:hypothetical protein